MTAFFISYKSDVKTFFKWIVNLWHSLAWPYRKLPRKILRTQSQKKTKGRNFIKTKDSEGKKILNNYTCTCRCHGQGSSGACRESTFSFAHLGSPVAADTLDCKKHYHPCKKKKKKKNTILLARSHQYIMLIHIANQQSLRLSSFNISLNPIKHMYSTIMKL